MDALTVRFSEFARYDPMNDREMVTLLGITPMGSYHARVHADGSALRAKRNEFKTKVVECMEYGEPPREIEL